MDREYWTADGRCFVFSEHFYDQVFVRRPYLNEEMCVAVVEEPVHVELQTNGRLAHWRMMDLFGNGKLRPLCVITLESGDYLITDHPDRHFMRRYGNLLP